MSVEVYQNQLRQLLCPPGEGVYTVHTGRERREALQQRLYGDNDPTTAWQQSLANLTDNTAPVLLGICSDNGGGIMRGANWGPLYVREAFYQAYPGTALFELGDVRVVPQLLLDEYVSDATLANCRAALYGDAKSNLPVSPLSISYDVAKGFYETYPQQRLVSIGGDHSCSYPMVKAYLEHKQQHNINVAVIHFDAHTDLLDRRLGIDICFGTWTYHALNMINDPAQWVQLGIRSSGKPKQHWESTLGLKQYWAEDIQQQGSEAVAEQIIKDLTARSVEELYITFDIDAIDATVVGATGTPEPNGLKPQQAIDIIERLGKAFPVTGADLMEVAPLIATQSGDKTLNIAAMLFNTLLTA
ncbi:MAG: arginase [Legionellales bacterium]|mgnify:CR=1 FL=1|nr:arginase [Legionellales bacterium]|tara:strand:+ start:874 stop:1947 length:1074 start_codon:yes stop_codon:yes gene_type:complete